VVILLNVLKLAVLLAQNLTFDFSVKLKMSTAKANIKQYAKIQFASIEEIKTVQFKNDT
jgi:hypothetical protein